MFTARTVLRVNSIFLIILIFFETVKATTVPKIDLGIRKQI
jgi:hypothetical protein